MTASACPSPARAAPSATSTEAGVDGVLAPRTGDLIAYEPRPKLSAELRACSFRHPLCVHAPRAPRAADEALALLDAADHAWDVATGALELPAPDASGSTGALDLYLVDGEPHATRVLLEARDPESGFDRASAFALVGQGGGGGCPLYRAAARVIARAILFRVAPATDEASALAESTHMASLMVPCSTGRDEITLFQSHPEVGLTGLLPPSESLPTSTGVEVVATPGETYARGASLFYDWVEDSFGGYPGAIVRAMWAESPTVTSAAATRWNDEPDGFDVLRTSFKNALTTGSTVDDLWLDFAVARAFVDGAPVRIDWSVDWPERPRTLMSAVGVAPTGAAYVSIDCSRRPAGARLRVEARWEEHARILWALVRVDATGKQLGRVDVTGRERGTEAQATLVDLEGTARVLVVGANAGDPRVAVDPDDYRLEPHGWVVSLAAEPSAP